MELYRILAGRRAVYSKNHQQLAGGTAGRTTVGLALLLFVLTSPGCKRQTTAPDSQIRVIDTVADADSIALYVSNKSAFAQTPYGASSNFIAIPSGSYTGSIAALNHGKKSSDLTPFQLNALPSHRYTGIAVGNALSWPHGKLVIMDDDADLPAGGSGKATIRVVDAYPSATKLDLIFDNIVAFSGLDFGSNSDTIQLPAGICDTKVLEAGTYGDPMAGPYRIQLAPGKSYILVLLGQQTATQAGIMLIPED